MKKKLFLAGLLVAALMTASCSDDISDDKGGLNDSKNEVGYVKVSINLPSASGNMTKANENGNDNFDDGVEAEYNVKDVILAIFEGTSESDAKCINTKNLTDLVSAKVSGNITIKYSTIPIDIQKPADNKKLYALVIANGKSIDNLNNLKEKSLSDLNTMVESVDLSKIADTNKGYFLMTNSPISNEPGATQKSDSREVTTLVPLTVYDTKAQAEASQLADQIYLERAVAKVTTSVNGDNNELEIKSNIQNATYDGATVTFEGWRLQLTNKKFYPVRNVADWKTWDEYYVGDELNRFYGYVAKPFRVYWAIDPNYGTTNDDDLNKYQKVSDVTEWNGMGNNEYCAENTTTAGQMNQSKLTTVLLKAKFRLKGATEDDNLFMGANTSAIYKESDFIDRAESQLTGENALSSSEHIKVKDDATEATITTAKGVQAVFCKNDGSDSELSDDQAAAILKVTDGTIKFYKGGVMYYYSTVIKHFGDKPTEFNGDTANPSYEEDKHLGRYGVVRNNWYELRINSVSGPGEPEIPTIPDEPVDKKQSYINAEINVLSWAKRTENIEL